MMMMTSRTVVLFLWCLVGLAWAEDTADRPNVLFILADDVGQEVLGCYGGESYPTPHLDELARTGMRFRHAYSMPVCHPSRLTLMTGKYPESRQDWLGSLPARRGGPYVFQSSEVG